MSETAVVILNWNGAAHLRRFLPSVVDNTPRDVAIIVADNASTDDSCEIVERDFGRVRLLRLDRNYGFAEGYNRALSMVDADYCVLLNSDVETPEGWLEPLVARLEADRNIAAVAPKIMSVLVRDEFEYAGAAGGFIDYLGYPFCRGRIMRTLERDEGQYDDARRVFWSSGAAMCCRREVFVRLGGFAGEFFAHMEEIDLCWRMQLAGYSVEVEPRSRVYHLGGGTLAMNTPRKIFYNHRNNLAMIYRCASGGQRLVAAVVRPVLDMLAALSYLVGGNARGAWAVCRAYGDFIRWHGRLSAERKTIRAAAVREPDDTIYGGSIVARYMLGRRKFGKMM
ncbi:MAG: glycosyltransferase family 2 protein [Alistipes sp.]|nr:glycosyltransferase family 2 protein [Alistipes sp.]